MTLLGPEGALYDDYTMIRPDIGRIFTQLYDRVSVATAMKSI